MPNTVQIFAQGGPLGDQCFALTKPRSVLGRHPACDIVIDCSAVSRQHASIVLGAEEALIEDLGSRNGTLVNGRPLQGSRRLEDGDDLRVGTQRFRVAADGPASAVGISAGSSPALADSVAERGDSQIISRRDMSRDSVASREDTQAGAILRAVRGLQRLFGESQSLDDVLRCLLDGLFDLFPDADRGFVFLPDSSGKRLLLRASRLKSAPEEGPLRVSLSLMETVVRTRQAVLSADASADSRFRARDSVADCRLHSLMCVPFIRDDGAVIGVAQIDSGDTGRVFLERDLDLFVGIAEAAVRAIEQALAHDELIGRERLKRDLELAQRVQQSLLPSHPPQIAGYEAWDHYESAGEIGGDLFAYVPLPEGRIAFVMADVSGKGVSAALVMATLSADVRYCLASEPDVARAVARINEGFCRGGWDDRFATLMVLVLDPGRHRLTVVNAGHLPLALRSGAGAVRMVGLEEGGLPLGVDVTYDYESLTIDVEPGTMLVVYTDGISEALDHAQRPYGLARLERVMAGPVATAADLGKRILADVNRHAAGQSRSDDICLICLARLPA